MRMSLTIPVICYRSSLDQGTPTDAAAQDRASAGEHLCDEAVTVLGAQSHPNTILNF